MHLCCGWSLMNAFNPRRVVNGGHNWLSDLFKLLIQRPGMMHNWSAQSTLSALCRLVKVDLATAGSPESWDDLIPQHETDLLQWASAHDVSASNRTAADIV